MRLKANGKLLLTGEYFVLDGARALAVPTKFGQVMEVNNHGGERDLYWSSHRDDGSIWLYVKLDPWRGGQLLELQKGDRETSRRLSQIIQEATKLNPAVPGLLTNKTVTTKLEFPNNWGLGSSSTLIWMLAKWWEIDPYILLANTFGGSGYDLACAGAESAIEYWRDVEGTAHWRPFEISATWVQKTFFVHLNRKQNSREGIERYRSKPSDPSITAQLSKIGYALRETLLISPNEGQAGQVRQPENERENYLKARTLLSSHEALVSNFIGLKKVQEDLFPDFEGTVKSLGAWGGDFVWVLPEYDTGAPEYFRERGYDTVLSWVEMIA